MHQLSFAKCHKLNILQSKLNALNGEYINSNRKQLIITKTGTTFFRTRESTKTTPCTEDHNCSMIEDVPSF